jgi:hypothetical protein
VTPFRALFISGSSAVEAQQRARCLLPARVEQSPLRWWSPDGALPEDARFLLIGAAVWSGYDMNLLDHLDSAVTSGIRSDTPVYVFDADWATSPEDFESPIPGIGFVHHTPVVGCWAEGKLIIFRDHNTQSPLSNFFVNRTWLKCSVPSGYECGSLSTCHSSVWRRPNSSSRFANSFDVISFSPVNRRRYRIWLDDCHPMPWRRSPKPPEAPYTFAKHSAIVCAASVAALPITAQLTRTSPHQCLVTTLPRPGRNGQIGEIEQNRVYLYAGRRD